MFFVSDFFIEPFRNNAVLQKRSTVEEHVVGRNFIMLTDIGFKLKDLIEECSASFAMIIFGALDDKDIDVLTVACVSIKSVIELCVNLVVMFVLSAF